MKLQGHSEVLIQIFLDSEFKRQAASLPQLVPPSGQGSDVGGPLVVEGPHLLVLFLEL